MRTHLAALRALLVLTLVVGFAYPVIVYGVGRLPGLQAKADGSLLHAGGRVVGSSLIGQSFTDPSGAPLPRYFQTRPGAYDPTASGASNLGPESNDLLADVQARRAAVAALEGVSPDAVPPDAVTASASGLDPGISVAYADLQAPRVARARNLPLATVLAAVHAHTVRAGLGFLGEPWVNVLEVNAELDAR